MPLHVLTVPVWLHGNTWATLQHILMQYHHAAQYAIASQCISAKGTGNQTNSLYIYIYIPNSGSPPVSIHTRAQLSAVRVGTVSQHNASYDDRTNPNLLLSTRRMSNFSQTSHLLSSQALSHNNQRCSVMLPKRNRGLDDERLRPYRAIKSVG